LLLQVLMQEQALVLFVKAACVYNQHVAQVVLVL
jgi:hypothetical protein